MNKYTKIINAALDAIEKQDATYADKMFAQRLPEGGMGSIYPFMDNREELESAIRNADYEPAEHPAVAPGCTAYVTHDLMGAYGMVLIEDQPEETMFVIADPKNTGKVSLMIWGWAEGNRLLTNETWVIVGPNNGEDVVYTFHPGQPVPRATTSTEELPVGTKLTKKEALELGFNMAKLG